MATLREREAQLKKALLKIAELEEDNKDLASAAADLKDENDDLKDQVENTVGAEVDAATDPDSAQAVSDDTVDKIIDAVADADPSLADSLQSAVDDSADEDGNVPEDKMASLVVDVIKELSNNQSTGRIRKKASFSTTRSNNVWEKMIDNI